ncbi:hypothetical protein PLIIFM63780_010421 [Purpureocillium lilacinum]|nr:hypothetical protein PLIIFM63780_010421 [Purpureocillium lilacinum]
MDAADKDGRAALSHAAENWHEAVVRLLFDRGAAIDAGDKDGRTPLSDEVAGSIAQAMAASGKKNPTRGLADFAVKHWPATAKLLGVLQSEVKFCYF